MKKTLLTLAMIAGLTSLSANAEWTRVTSVDQLKANVDYVIVSDVHSTVMTTGGNISTEANKPSWRTGAAVTIADSKIATMPADAAKIQIAKSGSNYYLQQQNAGAKGYIGPSSQSYRTIFVSENPTPNSIHFMTADEAASKVDDSGQPSVFSEGNAVITATSQPDKNILGMFKNPVNGVATPTFQYVDQNDEPISLYMDASQTGCVFPTWTIDPADGTKLTEAVLGGEYPLTTIAVTFTNAKKVDLSSDATLETLMTATHNGKEYTAFSVNVSGRNNIISLSNRTGVTESGTYRFQLNAGQFEITLNDGSKVLNPAIVWEYTIPSPEATYEFSPVSGSTIDELKSFELIFGNVKEVDVRDDLTQDMLKVTHDGVLLSTQPTSSWYGTPMKFTYSTPQTAAGEYVITFEAETFNITLNDGTVVKSPKLTATYTIGAGKQPTDYVTVPANNGLIKAFNGISVEFPNANTVALGSAAEINVKDAEGNDISGNFTYKNISGKTINFGFMATAELSELGAGTYSVSFPAGSFTINGSEKSPAISFTFTIDPNMVEGNTLKSYIKSSNPAEFVPVDLNTCDGINRIDMELATGEAVINKDCTEPVVLKRGNDIIGRIPASNTYNDESSVELYAGSTGFQTDVMSLIIRFSDKAITTPGKYSVTIPTDFFRVGNEVLQQCTLDYCIGIGEFIPMETVNLSSPGENNASVVVDGALTQLKLQPWYSSTVPNGTEFDDGAQSGTKVAIQGVDAKAVLYRVNGKELTEVASFVLDSPLINEDKTGLISGSAPEGSPVSMQRGMIIFNLRQGDNKPINVNGDYELRMPWNFFRTQNGTKVTEWPMLDYNYVEGAGFYTHNFTITGGRDADAPEQKYTMTPEAGNYNPFPTVTITYDGCSNITVKEGAKAELYYGTTSKTPKYTLDITAEGNIVTLTPATSITEVPASEYQKLRLIVPEGSYTLTYNGKDYENYAVETQDYQMKDLNVAPEVTPSLEPGSNVTFDQLNSPIVLTFNTPIKSKNPTKKGELLDATGKVIGKYNTDLNTEKTQLTLTPQPNNFPTSLEPGTYTLRLPATLYYYLGADGKQKNSALQTFEYTISMGVGVDGIEADNSLYTVYTFSGICLMQNAPAERLGELQPGMYIINGKKVLVK